MNVQNPNIPMEATTSILSLDLGTLLGWALWSRGDVVASGVLNLKPRRFEGGGMRYLRFRSWMREQLCGLRGDLVVAVEEVRRHLGTDAAHVYGGLLAVVQAECEDEGVPYQGVPVGTIKRVATGKGNAAKGAMIAAAVERWPGFEPASDDEADARWIAVAAARELGFEVTE